MPHAPPIVGRYGKPPHSRMRHVQLRTVHARLPVEPPQKNDSSTPPTCHGLTKNNIRDLPLSAKGNIDHCPAFFPIEPEGRMDSEVALVLQERLHKLPPFTLRLTNFVLYLTPRGDIVVIINGLKILSVLFVVVVELEQCPGRGA